MYTNLVLIARPLAECASVLVASPGYLKQQGTPLAPHELPSHRCLSYPNFGKSVWKLQRGDEQAQVGVARHFSANEATVLLHAALAGGALVAVLPEWQVPVMTMYALYPSRRHLSPAVRALLDFLMERFRSVPW